MVYRGAGGAGAATCTAHSVEVAKISGGNGAGGAATFAGLGLFRYKVFRVGWSIRFVTMLYTKKTYIRSQPCNFGPITQ